MLIEIAASKCKNNNTYTTILHSTDHSEWWVVCLLLVCAWLYWSEVLQIQRAYPMIHDFIPVNLLFCLLSPTNLFCALPFICIFKYFLSYFPASCRELQLASRILCISAANLFIACPCSRELPWICFCRGALLEFLSSPSDTFFEVLSDISSILCRYIPLLMPTLMVHIGRGSVEQKWESNLCQSYSDFELNLAPAMTMPDWNLRAALINQDTAFDAV